MSDVIDWSRYGRMPKRERVEIEVSYREEGGRIICTASFPLDRADEVLARLKAQREFWRGGEQS